jgi:hypothetical protein
VAIDSYPAEGVKVIPHSQIKASFPVLKNPANRRKAVGFTPKQFHYAFTNTLSEEESAAVYERYHIPALGHFVSGGTLGTFISGHTWSKARSRFMASLQSPATKSGGSNRGRYQRGPSP